MNSAIIVAAGSGRRMGSPIAKQFIEINGKTILEHTLDAFYSSNKFAEVIVVLSNSYLSEGEKLKNNYKNLKICLGGKERFHSVKNAMQEVNVKCKNVFIHDSVRPFVSKELIERCLKSCHEKDSAVPAVKLKDSIRMIHTEEVPGIDLPEGRSSGLIRDSYRNVQTPQAFNFKKLLEAYEATNFSSRISDDASVYEQYGGNIVYLVDGDPINIKITTPEDLEIAQLRLSKKTSA